MAVESNGSEASLQSICYERGSLRLLDQRKLPLETVYLEIRDSTDGWDLYGLRLKLAPMAQTSTKAYRVLLMARLLRVAHLGLRITAPSINKKLHGLSVSGVSVVCRRNAVRDMVVRGAPAIAIAAALSLAVEVFNLNFSGTPRDAVSFMVKKLEYLVSSRPTAVNLSDAATKLQNLVSKVAETAANAETVFQAYIDAAETMLTDDVADNKAIGFHGASLIQRKLKDMERLSVLTHCNTGSLATAGYGTALGVIRALHMEGILERAFCTETRPFNQGSRLTAFELVHDRIPATLVADSAAAALMKAGCVSAVIVGADRIAANGDTANKIGTYSLAVCASYHGIAFYVAAPVTSIDLSISSGDQIVIEERSANELLYSDGGRGKQVAASGIAVWNPAFDVTPANLITAIITEKGVITKDAADAFDIKEFLQNAHDNK